MNGNKIVDYLIKINGGVIDQLIIFYDPSSFVNISIERGYLSVNNET